MTASVPASTTIVRVAVDAPQHTELVLPLSYLGDSALAPGTLVRAPLGGRVVSGIVWSGEADGSPAELRPLGEAMTALAPLTAAWCRLVDFTAAYYQRTVGEVALSVLPPELRRLDNAGIGSRIARLRKEHARLEA